MLVELITDEELHANHFQTAEEYASMLRELEWEEEEIPWCVMSYIADAVAFIRRWPHSLPKNGIWPRWANCYNPGDVISIGEDYVRVQGDVRRAA